MLKRNSSIPLYFQLKQLCVLDLRKTLPSSATGPGIESGMSGADGGRRPKGGPSESDSKAHRVGSPAAGAVWVLTAPGIPALG